MSIQKRHIPKGRLPRLLDQLQAITKSLSYGRISNSQLNGL